MSKSQQRRLKIQMKLSERIRKQPSNAPLPWADRDIWADEVEQLEAEVAAHRDNEGDECPLCQCEAELEKYRTKFADNTCAECLLYGIECDCDALKEGG